VPPAEKSRELESLRLQEAERHQRILSEVSRALLDYVGADPIEPLRRIVKQVAEALGDWCSFSLVQPDGTIRSVATFHPDPQQRELEVKLNALFPHQQWNAGPPELNALVQKRPVVVEQITDEMLRAASPDEEAFQALREVGLSSALTAPMYDGPKPLGTMLLASVGPGGRRYSNDDIDFAVSLAGRAALAVRNAKLVGEIAQERDRQRSERVEAERRFAELRAVFDSDPNGIALFDASGRLRLASHMIEEIFGIPLRAMYGGHYEDIYRRKLQHAVSRDREAMLARVQQTFADREARAVDEIELERPRARYLKRTSVPVTGPAGEYLGRLVVYVDVTEQRELDRQRAEFITMAAHELRTPLTPLSMYLQSMERRLQRQQPLEPELVSKARRQVDRLGTLVEDLLDVSRLESKRLTLHRERVDLNELADEVVADFRSQTRIHEIILHRAREAVPVAGDRARLEQVLVNLIGNAIKYSPQGGQIAVRVERVGGKARISVSDQGIGIPVEEQERLFQRFFRAANAGTRNFGGLGIGLFVSHEIVQQHGGQFEVKSDAGQGATFTFTLPLLQEAQPKATRARVLLVDDDPEILEATGQILREWGYAVDEARDGATALSLVRGSRPDLMLVDLMMPVMDGWTLIGRMREEKVAENVPLVVFSADRDAREKAKKLAADAALRKPFELEELQDVVERLLHAKPAA
jgi:signal transduction histidine kinase/ActR/RegA family two-component response regulator